MNDPISITKDNLVAAFEDMQLQQRMGVLDVGNAGPTDLAWWMWEALVGKAAATAAAEEATPEQVGPVRYIGDALIPHGTVGSAVFDSAEIVQQTNVDLDPAKTARIAAEFMPGPESAPGVEPPKPYSPATTEM